MKKKGKFTDSFAAIRTLRIIGILFLCSFSLPSELMAIVEIDSINIVNPNCYMNNGKIYVYASGSENLSYFINGDGPYQTGFFEDMPLGDYLIEVWDGVTCIVANSVQLASIDDYDARFINCPEFIRANCNASEFNSIVLDSLLARDNLGNDLEINIVEDLNGLSPMRCLDTFSFTAITSDQCDNEVNCLSNLIIADTISPALDCPRFQTLILSDENFNSDLELWAASIVVTEACHSSLTVENNFSVDSVLASCNDFITLDITFRATDTCGNESECIANLEVINELVPTVTCGDNLLAPCQTERDSLSELIINSFNDQNVFGEDAFIFESFGTLEDLNRYGCNETFVVEYVVTDNCGRSAICVTEIENYDDEAPKISDCPDTYVITEINDSTFSTLTEWLDNVSADDNCSTVTSYYDESILDNEALCSRVDSITVQHTVADSCGNLSACESTILFNIEPIVIICPDTLVLDCGVMDQDSIFDEWASRVALTFGYSTGISTPFVLESELLYCDETVDVVFNAIDYCGGRSECTGYISIQDTVRPRVICPANLVLAREEDDVNLSIKNWLEDFRATDDCGVENIQITDLTEVLDEPCDVETLVKLDAIDRCDNISSCSSNLIITENKTPLAEELCPSDTTMTCSVSDFESVLTEYLESPYTTQDDISAITFNLGYETLSDVCEASGIIMAELQIVTDCDKKVSCMVNIQLNQSPSFYLPNVFSLSAANREDQRFTIYGFQGSGTIQEFVIIDRWGNMIWHLDSPSAIGDENDGWDGRMPDGSIAQQGVYSYLIQLVDASGAEQTIIEEILFLN